MSNQINKDSDPYIEIDNMGREIFWTENNERQ
jgi:hypothetical protein